VITGTGLAAPETVKSTILEASVLHGAGFVTWTANVPAVAKSDALRVIVNSVELTKVTVCAAPLYVAVAPDTKFVPSMVSVSEAAPSAADEGERPVIVGTGLPTVKSTLADFTELELVTTTGNDPSVARSAALSVICNSVELTNVVVCTTPLKLTVEPETKFVPVMVKVCEAEPTGTQAEVRVVMTGVIAPTVPPPGVPQQLVN
jgi:hypothetical protein